jgi:DNA-binding transcriptional regulator YdaS (Cro superfamily)
MDKKLKALVERAVDTGASGHMLNMLASAKQYSGILEAVVHAGSLTKLASELGVSFQAVQQWVAQGFVPMDRIPEIESLYGVPRVDLMNPKYSAILAAPSFTQVQ